MATGKSSHMVEDQTLLPQDVVFGILLRLPVKSLCRFKCVSKQWHSLISSTQFTNSHLKRSSSFPIPLLQSQITFQAVQFDPLPETSRFRVTDLDFPLKWQIAEDSGDLFLWGSCDGLICIAVDQDLLLLWNPATKTHRVLPPPSLSCKRGSASIGFGFDSSVGDYKVVRAVCGVRPFHFGEEDGDEIHDEMRVEVFTLKSNSWRRGRNFPYCYHFDQMGVLVNETVHWIATQSCHLVSHLWTSSIVGLSLKEEEVSEVPPPECYDEKGLFDLGVLRGCLCLGNVDLDKYVIWVMQEYGEPRSWTKLISVSSTRSLGLVYSVIPLCHVKDDEILVGVNGKKLMIYNVNRKVCKTLKSLKRLLDSFEVSVFVESLVSPLSSSCE